MKILLYSGGKDSKKIYNSFIKNNIEFMALHFHSENIPMLHGENIVNSFVAGACDQTEDAVKLSTQNMRYVYQALGIAQAKGIKEIVIGITGEDFEKDFLKGYIEGMVDFIYKLGSYQGIKVTMPLLRGRKQGEKLCQKKQDSTQKLSSAIAP